MQQLPVHIAHLYLEMKSNIPVFPDAKGFLTHFTASNLCESSYLVSLLIFLANFENCFPWECFHTHLHSKQAYLCPSSGKGWGEANEGWYNSCPASTQQGNTNNISSPLNSLKRKSTFLWQSALQVLSSRDLSHLCTLKGRSLNNGSITMLIAWRKLSTCAGQGRIKPQKKLSDLLKWAGLRRQLLIIQLHRLCRKWERPRGGSRGPHTLAPKFLTWDNPHMVQNSLIIPTRTLVKK